jgi:hypothetical protein
VASYESDSYVKGIIAKLTLYPTFVPYFSWLNGLLKYKGRIWVGSDSELQLQLITIVEVVLRHFHRHCLEQPAVVLSW